jgi:membrane-associated phospholipid phosphatase
LIILDIKKHILLVLSLVVFLQNSLSQPSDIEFQPVKFDKNYIKSYWTDTRGIVSAPFRWDWKNWLVAATATGATVLVYCYDEEINEMFQRNQATSPDNFSKYFFDPMGKGLITIPLLGGFYVYGRIAGNLKAESVALTGFKAFILTAVFTEVVKYLTHRHRPYQDDPPDPKFWEGPFAPFKYDAFPSGHTSYSFAIATVYASAYKETIWVPVLAYTLASGVSLLRIYDNKHWASDILFSAVWGFVIGKFVYKSSMGKSSTKIYPVSLNGPFSFGCRIEFNL